MKIKLNNREIEVKDASTILDIAKKEGVYIPTLCHLNLHHTKMVNDGARCRVCMVEANNRLVPACAAYVEDGMEIKTASPRAIKARRVVLELLLSNHPKDCLTCPRNGNCDLQKLAVESGIREIKYKGRRQHHELDKSSYSIIRNKEKCILCGRCETMCNTVQTVGVYSKVNRGFDTIMTTAFDNPLMDSPCTYCGQCVSVCPTAALTEVDDTKDVWDAINNEEKFVICQTAPAVRVALGEMFGLETGTDVTGKMITSLRELGFDKVYDTNFGADLTVIEESKEFLDRLENNGPLPLLTSCCPAWVNFIEDNFPELLDIPSTCKSPHEMFGAIAKEYLSEKLEIDKKRIVVVSVMPCLAKKYEARREELTGNVDYVITTRELAGMIKLAGLNFNKLSNGKFDELMGESTGAAILFGTTGGVIEAVVRNIAYEKTESTPNIEFKALRGIDGIREAVVNIEGKKIKIAMAHGLGNTRKLLEKIKNKECNYHAIEIMACPGGCIGGGGQPYYLGINDKTIEKRRESIYKSDKNNKKRVSSENREVKKLYKEFLGEVGGKKAHELLHTTLKKHIKNNIN